MSNQQVEYVEADAAMQARIAAEWGEMQARNMHIENGFAIVALAAGQPAGLLSVSWRELPAPLQESTEAFIDIIEVREGFRRQKIARRMIGMAAARAREHGACQIRAWSSDDKLEAIPMWQALGFGLCPSSEFHAGKEIRGFLAALAV